jgi:hypothetical protein
MFKHFLSRIHVEKLLDQAAGQHERPDQGENRDALLPDSLADAEEQAVVTPPGRSGRGTAPGSSTAGLGFS